MEASCFEALTEVDSDLANAPEVTYDQWKRRSIAERGPERLGWVLERQQ